MTHEFQILAKLDSQNKATFKCATEEKNMLKNRYPNILPSECIDTYKRMFSV